jgi:hypothetical protein
LIVVPDVPSSEDLLEPPVLHRAPQDDVYSVAKCSLVWSKDSDVSAECHWVAVCEEAGDATHCSICEDVIEQHRVDAPDRQVSIWMDIIVIRDRDEAVRLLRIE